MILLAAGNSSRMGECKFLLKTADGITFLEKQLNSALLFPFNKITVVSSLHNYARTDKVCSSLRSDKIEVIINQFPERERFYSIQCGLRHMIGFDHCFIQNADNPELKSLTLYELDSERKNADCIIPVNENKGGHPVLIGKTIIKDLLVAPENSRLDKELEKYSCKRVNVQDNSIHLNIDTPEDYKNYIGKTKGK